MIPVLGLLVCGYIIVRMVEILSKPDLSSILTMLAVFMILGAVAAGAYYLVSGGIIPTESSPSSGFLTDTTTFRP